MAPARMASMVRGLIPEPPDETTPLDSWTTLTTCIPSTIAVSLTAVATATYTPSLTVDVIVNKTKITARGSTVLNIHRFALFFGSILADTGETADNAG